MTTAIPDEVARETAWSLPSTSKAPSPVRRAFDAGWDAAAAHFAKERDDLQAKYDEAVAEMHKRELHHFEVEQAHDDLLASVAAIRADTWDEGYQHGYVVGAQEGSDR